MKSTRKQTKTVLHLPYRKAYTKERFLLVNIRGSYNCCYMFQYKILRCVMNFLKRRKLESPFACLPFSCHAHGITNIDRLASSLFIVRSVCL